MFTKKMHPSELGLSCVENYTLSILDNHFNNMHDVFSVSYLRAHELMSAIINNGIRVKNFSLLTRVHEIAFEALALINLSSYDEEDMAGLWSRMKKENDNLYYLIKVTPSFTKTYFNANLQREDHYICYWYEEGKNIVFNDYPYIITNFVESEISKGYNGNAIILEVTNEIANDVKSKAVQMFYKHMSKMTSENNVFIIDKIDLEQLKEFLIIYKRILQRTMLYCRSLAADIDLIRQNLALVDNLLTKIYIFELKRKKIDFFEDIYDIFAKDQAVFELLNNIAKENIKYA